MKLVRVNEGVSKRAGFNHEEAAKAHAWVMADPDYALAALPFVLHELVQNEIFDNHTVIQKAIDTVTGKQLEVISKAFGADPRTRDAEGQFARVEGRRSRRVTYTPGRAGKVRIEGVEATGHGLSGAQKQKYAQALQQVADEMNAAQDNGFDVMDTYVRSVWRAKDGSVTTRATVGLSPQDVVTPGKFGNDETLVEVTLNHKPPLSAGGVAYDLVTAMSNPRTAAALGSAASGTAGLLGDPAAVNQTATRLHGYNTSGQTGDETGTTRMFNRLRGIGDLATRVMGDNAPPQAKLAAQVASVVGEYGPEAEKVIGPATRRAAYRYRGVEKKPDPRLQGAIDAAVRETRNQAIDGGDRAETNSRARHAVIYGWTSTETGRQKESPLIDYFKSRLPNPDLYELQRQSGTIPPSQGVIIDRHGRVAHESVGYGEDWYLPFNLKNLKDLKGGEYVRTRAYGGLTTEDVYTGLVSGARSVTVVSNSGIFTLEFDDSFRGGRRLNDKAGRMVSRYGQLLDAVKSRKVAIGEIEPSRFAELKDQAAERFDPVDDPDGYEKALENLKKRERVYPKLSAKRDAEITVAALDEGARDFAGTMRYDGVKSLEDVIAADSRAIRARELAGERSRAAAYGPDANRDDVERMARIRADKEIEAKWGSPEAAAETLGIQGKIAAQKAAAIDEQRRRINNLSLDGSGYDHAGQALMEQFPYYVSRYSSRELRGPADEGYVKPRFNRPAGARVGYFDPTIGGGPKRGADTTGFQNYGRGKTTSPEEPERDAAPATSPAPAAKTPEATPPAAGATLSAQAAQRAARKDAVDAIRKQTKISERAGGIGLGVDWDKAKGNVIGDKTRPVLEEKFPAIFNPSYESTVGPMEYQRKLDEEFKAIVTHSLFDVDLDAALGRTKAKSKAWDPVDAISGGGTEDYDFGDQYAADAGGSDPEIKLAHFVRLFDTDEGIRRTLRKHGLAGVPVVDLPQKLAAKRAEVVDEIRGFERQEADHASDPVRYRLPVGSKTELLADLKGLDLVAQVARHAAQANDLRAKKGTVAQGDAETEVQEATLVTTSPAAAEAAAASIAAQGGVAISGGQVSPTWWEQIQAQAGIKETR